MRPQHAIQTDDRGRGEKLQVCLSLFCALAAFVQLLRAVRMEGSIFCGPDAAFLARSRIAHVAAYAREVSSPHLTAPRAVHMADSVYKADAMPEGVSNVCQSRAAFTSSLVADAVDALHSP